MTKLAKIALAAGGTGGHLFPAAALAAQLQALGHEVHLLTDQRGLAYAHGFDGVERTQISSGSIVGKGPLTKAKSALALLRGIWQARQTIRRLKIEALVGFGGYPCVPPMVAAWALGIPSLLHEQNAVMGLANRQVSRFAQKIALSFKDTQRQSHPGKATHIGNPVRADMAAIKPKTKAPKSLHLLVFAGSQGARIMADLVPAAVMGLPDDLRQRLHLTLQIRSEDQKRAQETLKTADLAGLEITSFLNPIAPRMKAADLVIARSGASTVCELAAAGRPALLIPFSQHADAQQSVNATGLVAAGGAQILPEKETSAADLCHRLTALLGDDKTRLQMGRAAHSLATPNAAEDLAALTLTLLKVRP